jgi:hypothetical protein
LEGISGIISTHIDLTDIPLGRVGERGLTFSKNDVFVQPSTGAVAFVEREEAK